MHEFYQALTSVLADWRLLSSGPGGEEVCWQGSGDLPATLCHAHEPLRAPLPVRLAPAVGDQVLSLGPLLSVQRCAICLQPAVFFFDRNRYEQEKDRHKTHFLEYFRGHTGEFKDWAEVRRTAAWLPVNFNWQRE